MFLSKGKGSVSGLQFGSPKASKTFNSPDRSKMMFSKYPALSKNNLNLSSDQPNKQSFGVYSPRISSPNTLSCTLKNDDKFHTRHTTQFTDSLETSKTITNSSKALSQLEYQIFSLKNENKRLKQQLQNKIIINGQKQFDLYKINLNQQMNKQKLINNQRIDINKSLKQQNNYLNSQLLSQKADIKNINQKLEQSNNFTQTLKQELKDSQILQCQLKNTINRLEAEISQVNIHLKNYEEQLIDIKAKQNGYKTLICTMSQEKTLLNNRISELIQHQSKLQNAEIINKTEHSSIVLEKKNFQLTQQIKHLKNKIDDILKDQQYSSLKIIQQNKIKMLEKQIEQLKNRYQSTSILDNKNNEQKHIVQEKNRQIHQLKQIVTNLQNKIIQLNKQCLDDSSKYYLSQSQNNLQSEGEINNLRIQIKGLKKINQVLDEKLKHLLNQSKKKDSFLKQYLCTNIQKGQEFIFIQNFFKKYQMSIPPEGFLKLVTKSQKQIQDLEERIKYLSKKLYG